jgi:molybdenum cofactor cytidylyltransferase
MQPSTGIEAIILAAGSAARFGSDKRLYQVDGMPMMQRVIAAVIDAVDSVMVVLKESDRDNLSELLGFFFSDARVHVLLLNHPECGMGSNLAAATRGLSKSLKGVLVVLADMPFIERNTIWQIVSAYERDKIIVPVFIDTDGKQNRGHPVLFSRRFFRDLQLLAGDQGARSVLQHNADAVKNLSVYDRGILQDMDVPTA